MVRAWLYGLMIGVVSTVGGVSGTGHIVQAEELTIAAAPSLRAAFREIVPMFERERNVTIRVEYGPSQTQRRQIEKGEPFDVFLPAAIEEAQRLHRQALTLSGKPRVYAQTSLVLVMSSSSRAISTSFHDVAPHRGMRIVLGDPQVSSLGAVTSRVLQQYDPTYKSRFQLLRGEQAEEIVTLVSMGEADMGIVYRADAITNGQVRIIDETPAGIATRVQLGGVVPWTCKEASRAVAQEFLDFMTSPRIRKLLLKYGFDWDASNG